MKYVSNAFSPKMLKENITNVCFEKISESKFFKEIVDAKSIVGHEDIASMIGVEPNRESVYLKQGDELYCVLAKAERLPEGHMLVRNMDSFCYVYCKI